MILAQCVTIETYKKDKVEEAKDIFSASCATIRDHFGVEIDEHKLSSNRRASLFFAPLLVDDPEKVGQTISFL